MLGKRGSDRSRVIGLHRISLPTCTVVSSRQARGRSHRDRVTVITDMIFAVGKRLRPYPLKGGGDLTRDLGVRPLHRLSPISLVAELSAPLADEGGVVPPLPSGEKRLGDHIPEEGEHRRVQHA